MNTKQIDYLIGLLESKKEDLHSQYRETLKSKNLGMSHVQFVLDTMELTNSTIVDLERMKKEVNHGILGLNH